MAAPNIDMIAASLRNCSLNYQNTPSSSSSSSSSSSQPVPPLPPPATGSSGDLTVELNSNIALPFHWEQCLDITTGQVYYINWETGTRTSNDPRTFSSHISSPESGESNEYEFNEIYNSLNFDDSSSDTDTSYSISSVNISNMSSFSPTESSSSSGVTGTGTGYNTGVETRPGMGSQVLVAAGCKSCFMYFMIPKFVDICPKCGGDGLLHLDR